MHDSLFFIIFFSIFLIVLGTAALAGLKAAPFVPTRKKDLKRMLDLGQIKSDDLVYDLGAGDGRLVNYVASNYRAKVVGFEISILPYLYAKVRLRFSKNKDRAKIVYKDFLKVDLSPASVIVCFLTPMAMKKLEKKFDKELKKGTKIISYAFRLKGWEPAKISKSSPNDTPIYLYRVKQES